MNQISTPVPIQTFTSPAGEASGRFAVAFDQFKALGKNPESGARVLLPIVDEELQQGDERVITLSKFGLSWLPANIRVKSFRVLIEHGLLRESIGGFNREHYRSWNDIRFSSVALFDGERFLGEAADTENEGIFCLFVCLFCLCVYIYPNFLKQKSRINHEHTQQQHSFRTKYLWKWFQFVRC